jgi:hypothetical protein
MVAVGDKLGGRYFVTKVDTKAGVGSFVEIRDVQSNVLHAQLLGAKPLSAADITALARELAAVAPMPTLHLPDEVLQDAAGIPFAVFSRGPTDLLTDDLRLYESAGSKQRRWQTLKAFVTAFATLADELARAGGGARSAHGAIGGQHLGAAGRDDTLRLELRGFGVEPAARIPAKLERPSPRADAAALFLTLHELLERTQSLPEGAAAGKWNLMVTCARAGDHPALQHVGTLGRFLRDVLVEAEKSRDAPARAPAAPAEPAAAAPTGAPSPRAPAARAPAPAAPRPDLRAWIEANRNAVVGANLAAVAAVVAWSLREEPRRPRPRPPSSEAAAATATGGGEATSSCARESPAAPSAAELSSDVVAFDATCVGGSLRIVTARGDGLTHAARAARRGAHFEDPAALTFAAAVRDAGAATAALGDAAAPAWPEGRRAEPGTALAAADGPWFAWRDAARFTAAPLRGGGDATPLAGDFGATWRGAWLLSARAGSAWIASTAETDATPSAFALRLSQADPPETPRRFLLGDGEVVAAIPGDSATLLLRRVRGRAQDFSCVTVSTAALPVIASTPPPAADSPPDADPVATVPASGLQRTPVITLEAERITVTPVGLGRPGAVRTFLVTEGDHGAVSVLSFPSQGTPVIERLTADGSALALGTNGRGEVIAAVSEGAATALYTLTPGEPPTREALALQGVTRARLVSCGDEPWLAFATSAPSPRVAALPLECAMGRSPAR